MGVPNSEVGYTTAMPRREDHKVHKDMWWHWIKKIVLRLSNCASVGKKKVDKCPSSSSSSSVTIRP
jgi:hypothetical protein